MKASESASSLLSSTNTTRFDNFPLKDANLAHHNIHSKHSQDQHQQSHLIHLKNRQSEHFTNYLSNYFCMKNLKILATLLVMLFFFYHTYSNSFYGRNSCNRMLSEGYLNADTEWQPFGCMIHKYTQDDITNCFNYVKYLNGKNNFVFIGDGRIRQVYVSFINQFDPDFKSKWTNEPEAEFANETYRNDETNKRTLKDTNLTGDWRSNGHAFESIYNHPKNLNYTVENMNLQVHFIWRPMIDESLINFIETCLQPSEEKAPFIVIGMGLHYMQKGKFTDKWFEWFKGNLTNLVDVIKSLNYDSKYSSMGMPTSASSSSSTDDTSSSSASMNSYSSKRLSNSPNNLNYFNKYYSGDPISSIYWMLQDPVNEYELDGYNLSKNINNENIDEYNRASINLLYRSPVTVWSSSRLVSQAFNFDSHDGIHLGQFALKIFSYNLRYFTHKDSQLLYNSFCNDLMKFDDASCCSKPESISLIQEIIFSIFLICLIVTIILFVYKNFYKSFANFRLNISGSEISFTTSCKNAAASNDVYSILSTISKLSLIMLYFYACDRADFFMKENRHFTNLAISIPLVYLTVLGLFFHENRTDAKVMNRCQTDEIKGFMQIVILFLRLSFAEDKIPYYLIIRLFSSSYLFLSGYGHFTYFWNTCNYSITRFFEVLFRINFLAILLCLTMNRMYQFYSFIPLVTFWFICSYMVMLVYPRVSAKSSHLSAYFYMFVKLCVLIALIAVLNQSESTFENIFIVRPWKFLFVDSDDLLKSWRTNWSNDCYSFTFGMMFGLLVSYLKRINFIEDYDSNVMNKYASRESYDQQDQSYESLLLERRQPTSSSNQLAEDIEMELNTEGHSFQPYDSYHEHSEQEVRRNKAVKLSIRFKIITILISMGLLIGYFLFAFLCKSKDNCNHHTKYFTVLPIVAYVMIRNTLAFLKIKYSFLFNWFGKISLELYLCSFHVWLTADSNGVLVLLPGYPVMNMLITSVIFLSISHELHLISKSIAPYCVPTNNWKLCLRNFCCFLILLMPIAIKYGYI